jgi:hypothetical protein
MKMLKELKIALISGFLAILISHSFENYGRYTPYFKRSSKKQGAL